MRRKLDRLCLSGAHLLPNSGGRDVMLPQLIVASDARSEKPRPASFCLNLASLTADASAGRALERRQQRSRIARAGRHVAGGFCSPPSSTGQISIRKTSDHVFLPEIS